MLLLSRAEEIILLAVVKLDEEAYGVPIREKIAADIGQSWSFGLVYKTLKRLKIKGYVIKTASAPLAERGGRRRYFYRATPAGLRALEDIRRVQASTWSGVPVWNPAEERGTASSGESICSRII